MLYEIISALLSAALVALIVVENIFLRKKNKELLNRLNQRNSDFDFLLTYTLTKVMNQAAETEDYKTAAEAYTLIQKLNASQIKAKSE